MATTDYPVNHPLAVKLWSEKLFREALYQTEAAKFMSSGQDSVFQLLNDTEKGAGDKITYGLRMQLSGDGVLGDATLEGNEEALTTYSDSILIDQLRHAVKSNGKMSEQRVKFDVRKEAMMGLADWWAGRIDTALFNQLGGNTGEARLAYTGNNATVAPSSTRQYFANGVANETQVISASASNVFKLKFIDYAVERARTATPLIRPVKVGGEDKFVLFLHEYQVTDLRTDASTAGNWFDIQGKALQGGIGSKSPLYTGALGEYNNTIIHRSKRVPVVTTNAGGGAYRALFCGAQAGTVAFGQNYSGVEGQKWVEKAFDYGNQLGVSSSLIWGAKKSIFNSTDFGVIVLSAYAGAHS